MRCLCRCAVLAACLLPYFKIPTEQSFSWCLWREQLYFLSGTVPTCQISQPSHISLPAFASFPDNSRRPPHRLHQRRPGLIHPALPGGWRWSCSRGRCFPGLWGCESLPPSLPSPLRSSASFGALRRAGGRRRRGRWGPLTTAGQRHRGSGHGRRGAPGGPGPPPPRAPPPPAAGGARRYRVIYQHHRQAGEWLVAKAPSRGSCVSVPKATLDIALQRDGSGVTLLLSAKADEVGKSERRNSLRLPGGITFAYLICTLIRIRAGSFYLPV